MITYDDAHPNFRKRFTADAYRDLTSEFGIFGSDEAADLLSEWTDRRDELNSNSTLRQLLLGDDHATLPHNGDDFDDFVIGAGFTLLWLTGNIDQEGRELMLTALTRKCSKFPAGAPKFNQMISDLGGAPGAATFSDALREMVDVDFGTDDRRNWIAAMFDDSRASRGSLPNGYVNAFVELVDAMAASTEWRAWWQRQSGPATSLSLFVCLVDKSARRFTLKRWQDSALTWVECRVYLLLDDLKPSTARRALARDHVAAAVGYVAAKEGLDVPPELPADAP